MSPFWTVTRVVGAVFAILIIWQIGPEAIWSENTGGMLLSPDWISILPIYYFLIRWIVITSTIKLWTIGVFWYDDGENHASIIQTAWSFCS